LRAGIKLRSGESKTILILFLLGNKTVINVCFKLVIEILNENSPLPSPSPFGAWGGEENSSNRTNILFELANKLYRLVMTGLSNLNNDSPINLIDIKNKDINKIFKLGG
jgi:hypothetical protein